jgi:signal transduction histidine kinase
VAKHAGATQVSVELRYDGCGAGHRGDASHRSDANRGVDQRDSRRDGPRLVFCLRISDNGSGELPSQGQMGRGLRNMRERAQLLGGALDIQGTRGKGTVVTLEISDVETKIVAGRRP